MLGYRRSTPKQTLPMNELTLFLVDDDPYYLMILKQHLLNLGLQRLTLFDNGQDCLNNLSQRPDVVFLDYNMENLDGYHVLKKIKRVNPDIFVVIISGQEQIKTAVNMLKHGAFDYIQKEVDSEAEFQKILSRIVQIKELQKQSKPSFIRKMFQFL